MTCRLRHLIFRTRSKANRVQDDPESEFILSALLFGTESTMVQPDWRDHAVDQADGELVFQNYMAATERGDLSITLALCSISWGFDTLMWCRRPDFESRWLSAHLQGIWVALMKQDQRSVPGPSGPAMIDDRTSVFTFAERAFTLIP
jgi:hypothetical protein